ncbi:hypothetical protein B0A52_03186 [Exophiala mesophila]|uniref:Altered inheritance of mitochondria protein 24, mitochondrial n=1 Tax=Exophiala mesophila TaxID=212818 RepID=A0A438NAP4_EXOME|nr:hypothetical protein B0A52_03186 [Exophiala mesophila]
MSYQQDQKYGEAYGQGQYQQQNWNQHSESQQYGQQPPYPGPSQGQRPLGQQDHGSFPGGSYFITHRDTNAVLNIDLQQGAVVKSKSGVMIHMSGTVAIQGNIKFSMRKMFTGGQMSETTFTGPGRVVLGPTLLGDIVTLPIDANSTWLIGKDVYLASTVDVKKDTKSQGFGKAFFSGEDLFVYKVMGQGLLWLTSYGAVDRIDLQPGEHHIVDNGHLVAWNCEYRVERTGGSTMTSMKTGEGFVCRFIGPGSVYIQTRNLDDFATWVRTAAGGQG